MTDQFDKPPAEKPPPPPTGRPSRKSAIIVTSVIAILLAAAITIPLIVNTGGRKTPIAALPAPLTSSSSQSPSSRFSYTTIPSTTTPQSTTKPVATKPRRITAREWQLIAKNPDSHISERISIYGKVAQFDSATGTNGFRANVDGVVHPSEYGYVSYDTNTFLLGSESDLANLVEDDTFKADVTVLGSYSYGTQIGGNTTAPSLQVNSVTVTGHSK
ncbi:MAG: hypothetical protein QOI21_2518 [Actinomycetota bacterium]|jgi:hypothetical protein|nr:hypothetical protein [Actinomycetota bacterium]